MADQILKHNPAVELDTEMHWISEVINVRFQKYFETEEGISEPNKEQLPAPDLSMSATPYAWFIRENKVQWEERVAIALCLVVHLRPHIMDLFFIKNARYDRAFSQFGGWVPEAQGPFLPTGTTLLFILAGEDISQRLAARKLVAEGSKLLRSGWVELGKPIVGSLRESGELRLTQKGGTEILDGKSYQPAFSASFPAHRIESQRTWEELILTAGTKSQLEEIKIWIEQEQKIMQDWGMAPKLRPGYRALFHGPPGTGKTMAASLLGKVTGKEVYRIDLSLIISKYIGETEKNLAQVFHQAEQQNWILFFDEADALFGKRTEVKDAHDRYANQEVAYLLQRVEQYNGIVILASNFRKNLDDAFSRRFESMIYFPMPGKEESRKLWEMSLPDEKVLPREEKLEASMAEIAEKYRLSGGGIMNVGRYAMLKAADGGEEGSVLRFKDVMEGIRREYGKEGRSV